MHLLLVIYTSNTLHIQVASTVHEEKYRMLYELYVKEGASAQEKLKKAEDFADAESRLQEKYLSWVQNGHVNLKRVTDKNIRLEETITARSQKVADLEGEVSRNVISRRQMVSELDSAKKKISQLRVVDTKNAAKLEQMKNDLARIIEGKVIMANEEGEDQKDTFYYDMPSLVDDQAATGPDSRGVKKVHYLIRHLGSTVLKCSMFSMADEIISVKDTAGCYTTYIHTKKPCRAANIAQCLKAAAGIDSFRIVYIPSYGIKSLIQYRVVAIGIRHQDASLTMESTNASDQTPFRQFKQYLI